ncbi:MAG: O-antigen polymerase [Polaromonas sp.]|nr:O-antigen polymerase [Polaromonas sp.]
MAAAAVGLSMVLISISKLLLVICSLGVLLFARRAQATRNAMTGLCTPLAVLLCLFTFAASLFWTVAPQAEGLTSLAKYGKLIMIILLVLLVRDRREARIGLAAFVFAQIFLLASSWLLFAQFPVPWATSRMALGEYSVFSSYLDQGIMSAVFAAICWHLRACLFGKFGHKIAIFLVVAALANVFFVLSGRSGHLVAIALLSIGMMWELPKQYRAIVILLPFLLALGLFFSSAKVQDRLTEVATEVRGYSNQVAQTTSSGIRLQFWQRSLQSIRQHPMAGSGVGSWSHEFNRLEREQNPAHINIDANGNPHQEYLLWGVQLGIPGILLFIALLISVLRDTLKMETPYARATQSTLLALVIACMFNSSIYDAQIGDFFCVLIGLLLALGFTKTAGEATSTPPTSRLCE